MRTSTAAKKVPTERDVDLACIAAERELAEYDAFAERLSMKGTTAILTWQGAQILKASALAAIDSAAGLAEQAGLTERATEIRDLAKILRSETVDRVREFVPQAELLAAIHEADRAERHAGMVPIASVRKGLSRFGAAAVDRALVEAERVFVVDLKIANDPSRLALGEALHIDRGLAAWVVVR